MSPATLSAQFWSAARIASTPGTRSASWRSSGSSLPVRIDCHSVALRRLERVVVEAVVGRHAGAAVAHQPGFLELGQVGGHARLRQLGDRGQLGHGEFLALQQRQQAHAGGVGEHLQVRGPAFQIHIYLSIAI